MLLCLLVPCCLAKILKALWGEYCLVGGLAFGSASAQTILVVFEILISCSTLSPQIIFSVHQRLHSYMCDHFAILSSNLAKVLLFLCQTSFGPLLYVTPAFGWPISTFAKQCFFSLPWLVAFQLALIAWGLVLLIYLERPMYDHLRHLL